MSSCCVLVLRETQDNLGVHDGDHRDTVLVVSDRQTGQQVQHPVYRVSGRAGPGAAQGNPGLDYQARRLPGSVDPYAILSQMNGVSVGTWPGMISRPVEVIQTANQVSVAYDGPRRAVRFFQLEGWLGDTLQQTGAVIGDYSRMSTVPTAELFARRPDLGSCNMSDSLRVDDVRGREPTDLIRVDCDVEGEITSILLPLPAE